MKSKRALSLVFLTIVCTVSQTPCCVLAAPISANLVYDPVAMGRAIVVEVSYTNEGDRAVQMLGLFTLSDTTYGLVATISQGTQLVSQSRRTGPLEGTLVSIPARAIVTDDIILPVEMTPLKPGRYELSIVYQKGAFVSYDPPSTNSGGYERSMEWPAPPMAMNIVPPGTPTPERPRPWKEYEDPKLYPEFKRFLLAMPPHRLESTLSKLWFGKESIPGTLVRMFCDAEVPHDMRLQVVNYVRSFPRMDEPLKVALSKAEAKDIRLRAIALIGQMQENERDLARLKREFWRDRPQVDADAEDFRIATLAAQGVNERTIALAKADENPSVRLLAANWLHEQHNYQASREIALAVTNLPGIVNELFIGWQTLGAPTNTVAGVAGFFAMRAANAQETEERERPK